MNLLKRLVILLALVSGLIPPLHAFEQSAEDTVYATWWDGTTWTTAPVGSVPIETGAAAWCGPESFELEISLHGGVPGKTYYLRVGASGGAWDLVYAGDYDSTRDEMEYQTGTFTVDGVDVEPVPDDGYATWWPSWPYVDQWVETVQAKRFRGSGTLAFKGGTEETLRAKYENKSAYYLLGYWADEATLSVGLGSCQPSSCSSCASSAGEAGNNSVEVKIKLASDRFDGAGGSVGFHVLDDQFGAGLYSPALLKVYGLHYTATSLLGDPLGSICRIVDSSGNLKKIISSESCVDVVSLPSGRTGYELRFYRPAQMDASAGAWTPLSGENPYATWLFEDINGTGGSQLYVIKKNQGSSRWVVYNYTFDRTVIDSDITEQGWSLEVYDATGTGANTFTINKTLSKSSVIDTLENGRKIKTAKITTDDADVAVESWEKDFSLVNENEYVVTEHRVGVGSAAEKSTTYTYTTVSDRQVVQHEVDSDGRWTHYFSHDSNGRPVYWVEQYKNNTYNESTAAANNREFYIDGAGSALETTTEKIENVLVARRWRKLETWGSTISGENNNRKITEATATSTSASGWDDASNLATTTYLYDTESPSTGKRKNAPWLVVKSDGQAILKKYYYDTATVNGRTVDTELIETYEGVPSTTAPTSYSATITAGTETVEERTYDGQLVYRKVTDIGSSAVLEERLAVDFDDFGRVTEYKLFNNSAYTELLDYSCCGLASKTDAYGVRTDYTHDVLGRLATRVDFANGTGDQPSVRREFAYDPLDRRIMTLIGPYSLAIEEEVLTYNLAGELSRRDDGYPYRTTTYATAKVDDYIVRTTTAPDGSTQVEKRYQDGSLYEKIFTVSPTATRGVRYSYATDSSGNRSVTETPLDNVTLVSTAAVVRWTDFAGRPWKTVSPDPDESGSVEETRYYATPSQTTYKLGQLYKVTRAGRPDTLFTYDSLGRVSAQGEDINADGALTASGGTDRLRQFIHTYGSHSGTGYHNLTTRTWNASGSYLTEAQEQIFSPYPFTLSVSKPGQDAMTAGRSITASTATVIQTETQGALQTVTTTKYGRLASVVKKDYPAGTQLSAVTYVYDGFYGRLASQTDARNGTTTYGYDGVGRLQSIVSPDPDTTSTAVGCRPQSTSYVRTDLGSSAGYGWRETVSRVANSTTVEQTVSEYYPTGELRLRYGANSSPGLYAYDFAGRLKTLTTWRDFNLSTGAGTGTGDTTIWTYNDAGLLKTKRYPDNKGPDYTYDSAGRLKTREWARSAGGTRLKATYGYDSATGDLTGIDYSDNTWTTDVTYSGHDRLGRPGSVTDGSGTRTLTYTTVYPLAEEYTAGALDGHKVTATRTTGGRLDYLYTERDSASDYTVSYTWGAGNRLDNVFWWQAFDDPADGEFFREFTATYSYETNSDLVSGISAYFFDSLLYDLSQPYSSTPLTQVRSYDYLNRITSITATTDDGTNPSVSRSLAYTYNDRNQRTRATNQAGSYWSYGYDSDSAVRGVGQVSSAVRKVSGGTTAPGFDFGYAYDAMGNRTSATANSQTSTYYQGTGGSGSNGGNALNQYGSRGVPRVLDIAGLADSSATVTVNSQSTQRQGEHWFKQLTLSGNAAQWQSVSVSISTGGSSSGSVLLKEHPEVYAYDDDGNLTSDGRWVYTWDAENRLRRMETASLAYTAGAPRKRIDYAYDDRGRRTLKSVYTWNTSTSAFNTTPAAKVGFLYHDWNLLQEVDLSGSSPVTLRSYYWGLDLSGTLQGAGGVGGLLAADLDPATYSTAFYASDANGNVSDLAWCQGGFAAHYEYDAFGNAFPENTGWINLASLNPFRFSTKYTETDAASAGNETGLLYYGYRFYNPSTGRWPNRDPIKERGGINLYGMIRNNPISWVDPFGLFLTSTTTPAGIEAITILEGGAATAGTATGTGTAAAAAAGTGSSAEVATAVGVAVGGSASIASATSDEAITTGIANAISRTISKCRREKQCKLVDYYHSPNNPGGTPMLMCIYRCKATTGVYEWATMVPISEGGCERRIANPFD